MQFIIKILLCAMEENPHKQPENKGLVAIQLMICGCLTVIHRKILFWKMRHIIVDKLVKDTMDCTVLTERSTLVKTHFPTETPKESGLKCESVSGSGQIGNHLTRLHPYLLPALLVVLSTVQSRKGGREGDLSVYSVQLAFYAQMTKSGGYRCLSEEHMESVVTGQDLLRVLSPDKTL
jgi:hypothetical protein